MSKRSLEEPDTWCIIMFPGGVSSLSLTRLFLLYEVVYRKRFEGP